MTVWFEVRRVRIDVLTRLHLIDRSQIDLRLGWQTYEFTRKTFRNIRIFHLRIESDLPTIFQSWGDEFTSGRTLAHPSHCFLKFHFVLLADSTSEFEVLAFALFKSIGRKQIV